MKNKIIIFIFTIFLIFPLVVNGENKISRNYLKLTAVSSNDTESIEIKNTDLTNKDNAKKLVSEVNESENYNEIEIAPGIKFKGSAEEIYDEYANSVVLIGNSNKWATGSGFFIDHYGLKIITNWHVVDGEKNVEVWLKPKQDKEVDYLLNNGDSYNGKVVKTNKIKDLAMIEIKGISPRIKPVTIFGSISKIKEGQMAFAIGHPEGLGWTFTSGMISAVRLDYSWHYENSRHHASIIIQTQTPINQGNSGGPLFNKNKELIGVNTFTTAKAENLNFAVSVDDLIEFLNETQQEEIESQYIKKKKKGPTWIKKKKKTKDEKSTSNNISKKYPNAKKGDSDKNGITDIWLVDENNNGVFDTAIMDLNENGIIDTVGFDENENGNYEIIVFDDDEDGNPDRADIDKDDNGTSDIIAYDYNQDGEWDKYEDVS